MSDEPFPGSPDDMMAAIARLRSRDPEVENEALRARVARLEAALEEIGKPMLLSEMSAEQAEYADYEGAYETMINVAREALKDAPSEPPGPL